MPGRLHDFLDKNKSRIRRLLVFAFLLSLLYEFSRVEQHDVRVRFTFSNPHQHSIELRTDAGETVQRMYWNESGVSRTRAFSLTRGHYVLASDIAPSANCSFSVPIEATVECAF